MISIFSLMFLMQSSLQFVSFSKTPRGLDYIFSSVAFFFHSFRRQNGLSTVWSCNVLTTRLSSNSILSLRRREKEGQGEKSFRQKFNLQSPPPLDLGRKSPFRDKKRVYVSGIERTGSERKRESAC